MRNPQEISLNSEKLKAFPLKSEQDKGVHSHPLFHIVLEILVGEIRQEKEIKGIEIGRNKIVSICR